MYEFCNVIDHFVCWLGIVYNVFISRIVRWCIVWGLLVVYVKFLGLFQCWYKNVMQNLILLVVMIVLLYVQCIAL